MSAYWGSEYKGTNLNK